MHTLKDCLKSVNSFRSQPKTHSLFSLLWVLAGQAHSVALSTPAWRGRFKSRLPSETLTLFNYCFEMHFVKSLGITEKEAINLFPNDKKV